MNAFRLGLLIGVLFGFALFPVVYVVARDLVQVARRRASRRARPRGGVSLAALHTLREIHGGLAGDVREPARLSTPAVKGFGGHVRVAHPAGAPPIVQKISEARVRRRCQGPVDAWLLNHGAESLN